jgi:hypothetical protein
MLSFISLLSSHDVVRIAMPDIMHFVDVFVIIPSALGIIITGALLSALTQWGFTRYHWIIVKEVARIFLVVLCGLVRNMAFSSRAESHGDDSRSRSRCITQSDVSNDTHKNTLDLHCCSTLVNRHGLYFKAEALG